MLSTLEDYQRLGGPKKPEHWVDGRSAKEAARAWIGADPGRMPPEVSAAIEQHRAFGPVIEWTGEPEVRLPFDTFGGETRNTDLLVAARDQHGPYLIAVEAKADESFSADGRGDAGRCDGALPPDRPIQGCRTGPATRASDTRAA